jgi:hypothetical protein
MGAVQRQRSCIVLTLAAVILGCVTADGGADRIPGETWSAYALPEQAAFSAARLEQARAVYDESGAAGLLVIYPENFAAVPIEAREFGRGDVKEKPVAEDPQRP